MRILEAAQRRAYKSFGTFCILDGRIIWIFLARAGSIPSAPSQRFRTVARAEEVPDAAFVAAVNEVSFLAWAGGDTAYLNPFATGNEAPN